MDWTHDLQISFGQLQSLYDTVRNGIFYLHELSENLRRSPNWAKPATFYEHLNIAISIYNIHELRYTVHRITPWSFHLGIPRHPRLHRGIWRCFLGSGYGLRPIVRSWVASQFKIICNLRTILSRQRCWSGNWHLQMTLVNSTQYIPSFIADTCCWMRESAAPIYVGHHNITTATEEVQSRSSRCECMHCGDVVCECDIASISTITYYGCAHIQHHH